ncbi:MAG TPA: macro domain-containing protein [Ktedonobacterales bacterium]|jgi:O-acetyl-ADP-ribose deacetylase (regulator of RNase III)|nr:macro domain-containing protein [Ktedonobacterales bacterium]
MVQVLVGDILASSAQTLTNPVNCAGVMGKGLALALRRGFPEMYEDDTIRCREGSVRSGHPSLFRRPKLPWILHFPTTGNWRARSPIICIVEGLGYLRMHYREWKIASLAIPALGCGEGKLSWSQLGPTLYQQLLALDIPLEPYAPQDTGEAERSEQ